MISLSQLDIDRMRKLALYERSHSSQVIKNEQKHSLSKKRVEKWPNTLEAIRKKKEDFLVEREAEREKRFAEVDIQV